MGSDMSRPKHRRLQKIGEIDGLYSKSAIYRDPSGCGCGCSPFALNPCTLPHCTTATTPIPLCTPINLTMSSPLPPPAPPPPPLPQQRQYYPSQLVHCSSTGASGEPVSIQCVVNHHRKSLPMECLGDISPPLVGTSVSTTPMCLPRSTTSMRCVSPPPCSPSQCHRSRCSSPVINSSCSTSAIAAPSVPCLSKPVSVYYDQVPSDFRQSRYRTVKPHILCRRQAEEDIYRGNSTCGDNSRHFTITKTFHQPMVYDEVEKNVRLPAEVDMIPSDRIYEIRKEKIMIRADRNTSLSPVPPLHHHPPPPSNHHHSHSHSRSKSSDRYIDIPKSVRIVDDYSGSGGGIINRSSYDTDCEEIGTRHHHNNYNQQRLKSRSGYALNSDYETTSKSYLENYVETNTKMTSPSATVDSATMFNNISNRRVAPNCSNSEIIYVPMVKEEFIKRESNKLIHQPTSTCEPPSGTGLPFSSGSNNNDRRF